MSIEQRLKKIESQQPAQEEPLFMAWEGKEWTEEEKADALRQHPGSTFFWKTLSDTLPTEEIRRREAAGESLEHPGGRYIVSAPSRASDP